MYARKLLFPVTAAIAGFQLSGGSFLTAFSESQLKKPITDDELNKKPKWYADTVLQLEGSIKGLSKYQANESKHFLSSSIDILKRVESVDNIEITWRLGRALIEESEWCGSSRSDVEKKTKMLEEAITYLKKAIILEGDNPQKSPGAHKWYAIGLLRLNTVQKKHALLKDMNNDIPNHFETSFAFDSKDPFSRMELGVYYYNQKDYKKAIEYLKIAANIRENFSNVNHYYLGSSYLCIGDRDEALKFLKSALILKPSMKADWKALCAAKALLQKKFNLTKDELESLTWKY